jgi:hypothetical protein
MPNNYEPPLAQPQDLQSAPADSLTGTRPRQPSRKPFSLAKADIMQASASYPIVKAKKKIWLVNTVKSPVS